jgi:ABC-type nitrate/sulfonate/bicarbonate transport system substrate-binding protein
MDYTVFKVVIEKLGYNLEKDFIVSSLPVAALNVVLDKKESKAILTSDSLIIKPLVEKKYQRIANLNDMWKNKVSDLIPYTGLAAKDSWLKDHKDEAMMFSKTWHDASLFLQNHPEYFEKKEIVDALQLETQEEINEYRNITYSILPTEPWTENDVTMSQDFLNEIKNQAEFPDGFSTDIFTLLK